MEISLPLPRRPGGAAGARASRARRSASPRRGRARAWRELGAQGLEALRGHPRGARTALYAAIALSVLGGGWLWLRDSPLVAVREVRIAGVSGRQASAIVGAIDRAAQGMTTMDFSIARLRAALADYPIVASLSARTGFPHALTVHVSERPPVAVLIGPGERTALAADGTALGPALASTALPTIAAKAAPAPGARVREAGALAVAVVLGAAPEPLLRYAARGYEGPEGLTLQMRNGLLVYFGDSTLPHAKWLSLARVLASPGARGAVYVDVRLPSRPAAGFTLGVAGVAGAASGRAVPLTAASALGASDPAAAALAERLAHAAGGGASSAGASAGSTGEEERGAAGASQSAGVQSEGSRGEERATSGAAAESQTAGSVAGGAGEQTGSGASPSTEQSSISG